MRLFIAINFNENEKNAIRNISKKLEENARQGRFVQKEHMHLTLEFLGDTPGEKIQTIKEAIKEIDIVPFTMDLSRLGYFKRRDGNIYWLGIKDNPILIKTQRDLHNLLIEKGFQLQNRPYRPHITLGRRVRLKKEFEPDILLKEIEKISIKVNNIDLMKSEFINGRLVYTIL